MGSQKNFDNFEGFQSNDPNNAMLLDENMPLSFPDFNMPENLDFQFDPTFLPETNFAGNSQVNPANAFTSLGPAFNPAQNNASLTSQGLGYVPGLWDSQTGSPWLPVNPNLMNLQHRPQHMQGHPQQGFQPFMSQNIQGHTRGNLAQSFQQATQGHGQQHTQQPLPQYGQQQTQQPVPQYGQQPTKQIAAQYGQQLESRVPAADELRYKIKQPGTDKFKLVIRKREEAKRYKEVYLSLGDVDKKPREDIRGREEELIGRLYSAIRHYVKTEEGAGSEFENQMVDVADVAGGQAPKKRKRASTRGQSDAAILRLSPTELQMVCWELLEAVLDAQAGISSIPAWYTAKPHGYGRFDNLDRRLEAVEQVLRDSKIMCKSLLDGHEWQARIAWNPVKEAQRKSSNKQINKERSVLLKAGSAIIRGQRGDNENDDEANDNSFKVDDSEPPSKAIKSCPETGLGEDFNFNVTDADIAAAAAGMSSVAAIHASQTIDPSLLSNADPFSFTAQDTLSTAQNTLPTAQNILPTAQNISSAMHQNIPSMHQNTPSMHQSMPSMQHANPFSFDAQGPSSQPQADYSSLGTDNLMPMDDDMSFFTDAFASTAEEFPSLPETNPSSPEGFSSSLDPALAAEDPSNTGEEESAEDFFGKTENFDNFDWAEIFGEEPTG